MSTPSGKSLNYAPKEARAQPATDASPVKNDVDEYLRRLASSSEREGAHKRLPRAVPLLPVTGLSPVEETACAEEGPRSGETFIDGLRVPPSLVAERLRPPAPMRQHRNSLITALFLIVFAVAVPIAYFLLGSLVPEAESGREPKLASLDSRIVAPPLAALAQQKFRPNEAQDSPATAPPDSKISSQSVILSGLQHSRPGTRSPACRSDTFGPSALAQRAAMMPPRRREG
jgi:hypothetical protein